MRKHGWWFSLLLAAGLAGNSAAAGMADLAGTYRVYFEPLTSNGQLLACSLVYEAVFLDRVYKEGAPVMAIGNITVWEKGPGMSVKLGLTNVLSQPRTAEAPHNAFIRTQSGTTSGALFNSYDSDTPGYRVFAYKFDDKSFGVLGGLLAGENPTIAFNRHATGLDATFVLDLSVSDTSFNEGGAPIREHSTAAVEGFTKCIGELTASWDAK